MEMGTERFERWVYIYNVRLCAHTQTQGDQKGALVHGDISPPPPPPPLFLHTRAQTNRWSVERATRVPLTSAATTVTIDPDGTNIQGSTSPPFFFTHHQRCSDREELMVAQTIRMYYYG